jgi:hypothetical protein
MTGLFAMALDAIFKFWGDTVFDACPEGVFAAGFDNERRVGGCDGWDGME